MNAQKMLDQKLNNWLHSALLLIAMAAVLAAVGWLLGGGEGMLWTFILGALTIIFGTRVPPEFILRLYGARRLSYHEAPYLHAKLEELAERAALINTPRLYYVAKGVPNAFTVGAPSNAAIALTDGLLRRLDSRELAGILAHEVSHIGNNDAWILGLAGKMRYITHLLSLFGQLLILVNIPLALFGKVSISWFALLLLIAAPAIMDLLQLAFSRTREFDADLEAARITKDPYGLASALARLEPQGILGRVFPGAFPGNAYSLFRTHPHTSERISRLISLAGESCQPGSHRHAGGGGGENHFAGQHGTWYPY